MNAKEFFDKVVAMRKAQKEYFRTHYPETLRKAKAIEAEIDREIKRVEDLLAAKEKARQKSLFESYDQELLNRVDNI